MYKHLSTQTLAVHYYRKFYLFETYKYFKVRNLLVKVEIVDKHNEWIIIVFEFTILESNDMNFVYCLLNLTRILNVCIYVLNLIQSLPTVA